MKKYRADLHIHTVLSPCGDLDMSPRRIVAEAKARGLDLIAVTDHNSTLHGPIIRRLAEPYGIKVFFGAEVTTREEAHCLCLFETEEQRIAFQAFIDRNLPAIKNNPEKFGYQVVVDEDDRIIDEIDFLLISALSVSVDELEQQVHMLGGLFIPAHVDRPKYSLTSQLGFIPSDLKFDALEVFRNTNPDEFRKSHQYLGEVALIKNSDAHMPNQIGTTTTDFLIDRVSLSEVLKAFRGIDGRRIIQ